MILCCETKWFISSLILQMEAMYAFFCAGAEVQFVGNKAKINRQQDSVQIWFPKD